MNTACWLQLTAGQGPRECGWVVAELCKTMKRAANDKKLAFYVVESLPFDKKSSNQKSIEVEPTNIAAKNKT